MAGRWSASLNRKFRKTHTVASAEASGDLTARFRRSRGFSSSDREGLDKFCERGILGMVLAMLVSERHGDGRDATWQFLVLLGLGVGVDRLLGGPNLDAEAVPFSFSSVRVGGGGIRGLRNLAVYLGGY